MGEEIKLRVIVIDDDLAIRTWLKGLLTSLGCEIAGEAENGRDGVELFKKERPDMVLLDLMMPVMTGVEARKFILGEDLDAHIVLLTSVSDKKVVMGEMIAGVEYYLRKDQSPDEIKAALQENIDKVKSKLAKKRDNE